VTTFCPFETIYLSIDGFQAGMAYEMMRSSVTVTLTPTHGGVSGSRVGRMVIGPTTMMTPSVGFTQDTRPAASSAAVIRAKGQLLNGLFNIFQTRIPIC